MSDPDTMIVHRQTDTALGKPRIRVPLARTNGAAAVARRAVECDAFLSDDFAEAVVQLRCSDGALVQVRIDAALLLAHGHVIAPGFRHDG